MRLGEYKIKRIAHESALDVAMGENQRLTKYIEDYKEENAALKRERDHYESELKHIKRLIAALYVDSKDAALLTTEEPR